MLDIFTLGEGRAKRANNVPLALTMGKLCADQDLEVVCALRGLSQATQKRARIEAPVSAASLKWLDWPDFLKVTLFFPSLWHPTTKAPCRPIKEGKV